MIAPCGSSTSLSGFTSYPKPWLVQGCFGPLEQRINIRTCTEPSLTPIKRTDRGEQRPLHAQAGVKFGAVQALTAQTASCSAEAARWDTKIACLTRCKTSQTQTTVLKRLGCRRSQPASPCPSRHPMQLADQ